MEHASLQYTEAHVTDHRGIPLKQMTSTIDLWPEDSLLFNTCGVLCYKFGMTDLAVTIPKGATKEIQEVNVSLEDQLSINKFARGALRLNELVEEIKEKEVNPATTDVPLLRV